MKKVLSVLLTWLLENRLGRRLLISLGLDYKAASIRNNWHNKNVRGDMSLEQNMGFSPHGHIPEALKLVHEKVGDIYKSECKGNAVLDFGCGVGLYLSDFSDDVAIYGLDVSEDFIRTARERLPQGEFFVGDYLGIAFPTRFDYIYSVGVLPYISPSKIRALVSKVWEDLAPGGVVLIHYPHALSKADCGFPNLAYIQYSPKYLEEVFAEKFSIIEHRHAFDDRPMDVEFDTTKYDEDMERSVRNSSMLIARRKD